MKKFMKLYHHDEMGQILFINTKRSSGGPTIEMIMKIDGREDRSRESMKMHGEPAELFAKIDEIFEAIDSSYAFKKAARRIRLMKASEKDNKPL